MKKNTLFFIVDMQPTLDKVKGSNLIEILAPLRSASPAGDCI